MTPLKTVFVGLTVAGLIFFGLSFGIESLEPFRWITIIASLAALSFIPDSRLIRTAFSTAVLAALVFFVTDLISSSSVGIKSIDLTEDDRYTLTDGTRSILAELTEPVTINYYVTRDVDGTQPDIKRYIPRVDNFLRDLEDLANDDLITLNFIDPEPNTDEEDAALLDQLQRVPATQYDSLFFGASISSLDKKTVIPFFDPNQETQLEYSVISAIAEVSTREEPVVGLMSAHNLSTGGQSGRGWLFNQVLNRGYDVVDLTMMPTSTLETVYEDRKWGESPGYLDPAKIPVVLVIHPAGIAPEAEFALDQFLLRGGTVIACVDPMSAAAQGSGRPQIPGMPPQGGTPPTSTLPKLFEKHNVKFNDSQVIIDRTYAVNDRPQFHIFDQTAMPVEDDIALSSIQNLVFLLGGSFSGDKGKPMGPGLEVTRLVESSYKYTFVDGQSLTTPTGARELNFALASRRESDEKQAYVALLSGNFQTAFPDGDPSAGGEEEDEADEESGETEEKTEEEEPAKPEILAEASAKGNLYLIGDSDFLFDGVAYTLQRLFNQGIIEPVSGNGPFLLNILDQALGSKYLIGARARTPIYRQFTVLKDKEAEFEEARGAEVKQFEEKRANAEGEIQKIMSQMSQDNAAQRSSEIRDKIADLRREVAEANKSIREQQKSYQSEIDLIKAGIFFRNMIYVPLGVILIGLAVFIVRKRQTNAR